MTHHLQLSYAHIHEDLQYLLDYINQIVKRYQPQHISVEVLQERTHVFRHSGVKVPTLWCEGSDTMG
jgi:Holliday junction resolvasome RuvABC endonuclease subunit